MMCGLLADNYTHCEICIYGGFFLTSSLSVMVPLSTVPQIDRIPYHNNKSSFDLPSDNVLVSWQPLTYWLP